MNIKIAGITFDESRIIMIAAISLFLTVPVYGYFKVIKPANNYADDIYKEVGSKITVQIEDQTVRFKDLAQGKITFQITAVIRDREQNEFDREWIESITRRSIYIAAAEMLTEEAISWDGKSTLSNKVTDMFNKEMKDRNTSVFATSLRVELPELQEKL